MIRSLPSRGKQHALCAGWALELAELPARQ